MWNPDGLGHEPNRIVRQYAHLIQTGGYVLDLGAGNGRDTGFLIRTGRRVRAVDRQPDAVAYTQRRIDELQSECPAAARSYAECGDVREVTEPDGTVHGIVMVGVVHGMESEEAFGLYGRLQQWLAPGGMIFLTAPLRHFVASDPRPDPPQEPPGKRFPHTYAPDELPSHFPQLEIVHHEEKNGINHPVCLFVAQKPFPYAP